MNEPSASEASERSARRLVLLLLLCGAGWFLAGMRLTCLGSAKLLLPDLLGGWAWLTYGRVQPAAWAALVFGFIPQVGLGTAVWMMGRLSGRAMAGAKLVSLAAVLWNLGVGIGELGILGGDNTGVQHLEFPAASALLLFLAYGCMAGPVVLAFGGDRRGERCVSEWYVLGAVLSFPWIFSTGALLTVFLPLRGVLPALAQAWYSQNLMLLWLGFLSLAALYYLVPTEASVPLPNRGLAVVGFWLLAIFGTLSGAHRCLGGPFPAWVQSLGLVTNVLMLVPVLAITLGLSEALRQQWTQIKKKPVLAFAAFALVSFALSLLLSAAGGFWLVRRTTQFTFFDQAVENLFLQGFAGMAMCGAVCHVAPYVARQGWPRPALVRAQFWLAGGGVTLSFLSLVIAGIVQGRALDQSSVAFGSIAGLLRPFLWLAAAGQVSVALGALVLLVHLIWLVLRAGRERVLPVVKTWFKPEPPAEEVKP
jgi:cytochrome c oxidase cbb3-type subunit 1